MSDIKLKPCPFCCEAPKFWSCDRLITITCEKCNYTRAFDGLVGNKNTGIPVHYEGGEISTTEFYNQFAREEAVEAWNRRARDEDGDKQGDKEQDRRTSAVRRA